MWIIVISATLPKMMERGHAGNADVKMKEVDRTGVNFHATLLTGRYRRDASARELKHVIDPALSSVLSVMER